PRAVGRDGRASWCGPSGPPGRGPGSRGRGGRGVAGLDQAHAALAGDGEARVVAEVGNGDADAAGGFDQVVAGVGLDLDAVDEDLQHLGRSGDLGLRLRGTGLAAAGGDCARVAHCSTSPPIMLIESKMGIRSATACPLMRRGSAERIGNPGARTWMAYGFPFPFDTMWKPNSPLAPSQYA